MKCYTLVICPCSVMDEYTQAPEQWRSIINKMTNNSTIDTQHNLLILCCVYFRDVP